MALRISVPGRVRAPRRKTGLHAAVLSCIPPVALLCALTVGVPTGSAHAQIVSAPNSIGWTALTAGGSVLTDFNLDQQTGANEGDLVGDANNPLFYGFFDPGTSASLTDGTLYFRIRVGADNQPTGFKSSLLVGIDANTDGRIDLFAGVDNSGNPNVLRLWDPGNSLNTGPNNSSFSATSYQYAETALNFNFASVTSLDPNATPDINQDGSTDHFVSFGISFQDIVTQMSVAIPAGGRPTGINIDENTKLRFSVVTTQNSSNVNQDANGLGNIKNLPGDVGYDLTDEIFPGSIALPEPGTFALFALGGVPLLGSLVKRRRRRS